MGQGDLQTLDWLDGNRMFERNQEDIKVKIYTKGKLYRLKLNFLNYENTIITVWPTPFILSRRTKHVGLIPRGAIVMFLQAEAATSEFNVIYGEIVGWVFAVTLEEVGEV